MFRSLLVALSVSAGLFGFNSLGLNSAEAKGPISHPPHHHTHYFLRPVIVVRPALPSVTVFYRASASEDWTLYGTYSGWVRANEVSNILSDMGYETSVRG